MKRIYLACPYSHENKSIIEKRVRKCNKAAAYLMESGYNVFSPVSHSHPISQHTSASPTEHDFWLEQDLSFLVDWADTLVVFTITGWRKSKGISEELKFARVIGLPIYELTPNFIVKEW